MTDFDGPTWTEIEWVVLEPIDRPDTTPEVTRSVPYRARARGLAADPALGQVAEIQTAAGRTLTGVVTGIGPRHTHGFGAPLPAWIQMQSQIRSLLDEIQTARIMNGASDVQ